MYCTKCGNEIPDNVKFCVKCGNPTTADGQEDNIQAAQTGVRQGTVIVQTAGGAFQKVMLLIICAVFLVIMFVAVSFYLDNKNEKDMIQQQNKIAAKNQKEQEKAQKEHETMMANYENHRGTWKVDEAYIDGEWQDYNFWGEAIGKVMDFRNLYSFGNDTNYGAATTVELGADSVDFSSIGYGIYSLNSFSFEFNRSGAPTFTNDDQGIQFRFIDDYNPPYFIISTWSNDQWFDICTCVR